MLICLSLYSAQTCAFTVITRAKKTPVLAVLVTAILGTMPCWAVDYQPGDFLPLPRGTNVLMGYYEFAERGSYNNTITGTVEDATSLTSDIGIARYLHYTEAFDHAVLFDVLVPFGGFSDGEINGARLGSASGVADPLASVGMWFVNQPEKQRYVSAVAFVTFPVGTYDKQKALNLGGNRWQYDLQLDLTQGFFDRFTIDVSVDWINYGNNTAAGAGGRQTLTQASTYSAYVWLTEDITATLRKLIPTLPKASVSLGYSGNFGGAQKLDELPTGAKSEEQQIRLTYLQFFTPTWQGLLSVTHDVAVSGQFNQEFGVLLRVAKLF